MKKISMVLVTLSIGYFCSGETWAEVIDSGNLTKTSTYDQRVEEYNKQWLDKNHNARNIENPQPNSNGLNRQLSQQILEVKNKIIQQPDNPALYSRLGSLKAIGGKSLCGDPAI